MPLNYRLTRALRLLRRQLKENRHVRASTPAYFVFIDYEIESQAIPQDRNDEPKDSPLLWAYEISDPNPDTGPCNSDTAHCRAHDLTFDGVDSVDSVSRALLPLD